VIVALDVKNQPPSRAVIETKRPFFFARQPFIPQVGDNLNNQKKNSLAPTGAFHHSTRQGSPYVLQVTLCKIIFEVGNPGVEIRLGIGKYQSSVHVFDELLVSWISDAVGRLDNPAPQRLDAMPVTQPCDAIGKHLVDGVALSFGLVNHENAHRIQITMAAGLDVTQQCFEVLFFAGGANHGDQWDEIAMQIVCTNAGHGPAPLVNLMRFVHEENSQGSSKVGRKLALPMFLHDDNERGAGGAAVTYILLLRTAAALLTGVALANLFLVKQDADARWYGFAVIALLTGLQAARQRFAVLVNGLGVIVRQL